MSAKDIILIITTVPTKEKASEISQHLVENKSLAACVNIISNIESAYTWKNELVNEKEYLLLIKAPKLNEKYIYKEILALHPYDIPEIISVDISNGHKDYLRWILGVNKN